MAVATARRRSNFSLRDFGSGTSAGGTWAHTASLGSQGHTARPGSVPRAVAKLGLVTALECCHS